MPIPNAQFSVITRTSWRYQNENTRQACAIVHMCEHAPVWEKAADIGKPNNSDVAKQWFSVWSMNPNYFHNNTKTLHVVIFLKVLFVNIKVYYFQMN